mgnify:CR=1 FL=1
MGFWEGLYGSIEGGQLINNISGALNYKAQLARLQYEQMLRDWEKNMREKEYGLREREMALQENIHAHNVKEAEAKRAYEERIRQEEAMRRQREEQERIRRENEELMLKEKGLERTLKSDKSKANIEKVKEYGRYLRMIEQMNAMNPFGQRQVPLPYDEWKRQFFYDEEEDDGIIVNPQISPQDSILFNW